MDSELLASRMVGRWRSVAPLMLAPLQDDSVRGNDRTQNNNFQYSSDPLQRACPYASHIRKTGPRDDPSQNKAGVQTHRIIRAGIPFGPEVGPDETTTTARSRGLMFVCYQTSIHQQFEFIQGNWTNDIEYGGSKTRPSSLVAAAEPSFPASTRSSGKLTEEGHVRWTNQFPMIRRATPRPFSSCPTLGLS